jgi:hypothetical protein
LILGVGVGEGGRRTNVDRLRFAVSVVDGQMNIITRDEKFALYMARFYRSLGFNPIPSETTRKKPIYRFAEEYGWETMFPEEWFTEEAWEQNPTTNLQVITGLAFRLLVFDLDGAEAKSRWESMGRTPTTWITHRVGGNSWHVWFRTPKDFQGPIPKCFIWKGTEKHTGIERLCDRSMIVAPPSYHVTETSCRYKFMDNAHSPKRISLPAEAPSWVLRLKAVEDLARPTRFAAAPALGDHRRPSTPTPHYGERHLSRDELLDATFDKVGLAAAHGLRLTGRSRNGWAECHAYDRPDNNPSAAIHEETGVYVDKGNDTSMSYFDLLIHLGAASDFKGVAQLLSGR